MTIWEVMRSAATSGAASSIAGLKVSSRSEPDKKLGYTFFKYPVPNRTNKVFISGLRDMKKREFDEGKIQWVSIELPHLYKGQLSFQRIDEACKE